MKTQVGKSRTVLEVQGSASLPPGVLGKKAGTTLNLYFSKITHPEMGDGWCSIPPLRAHPRMPSSAVYVDQRGTPHSFNPPSLESSMVSAKPGCAFFLTRVKLLLIAGPRPRKRGRCGTSTGTPTCGWAAARDAYHPRCRGPTFASWRTTRSEDARSRRGRGRGGQARRGGRLVQRRARRRNAQGRSELGTSTRACGRKTTNGGGTVADQSKTRGFFVLSRQPEEGGLHRT